MKRKLMTSAKGLRFKPGLYVVMLIVLIFPLHIFAQADSAIKKGSESEEASTLISPTLSFICVQKGDKTIDLKAAMQAKVKGSFIKLGLLKVTFLQVTDSAEKQLGFVITDHRGNAVFNYKPNALPTGTDGKLQFKAVFAGNRSMEAADAEVTIKKAGLEITAVKGDSVVTVNVKLFDISTGTELPIPETVVGLFVKRLFLPLKVGEATTDTNGEATVEIPVNLPGDAKGNITLLAKLDENEIYGNLETGISGAFGKPVSDKVVEAPRALWSSHPPLWMMVTFVVLMIAVWGHYIVIVYELFRLRKEEPHPPLTL